uniref:Uncharacterized protein n=1 Tax=Nelumbo nucifera TaxID=4432 RepID=A0A822Y198_NELNU|nr:TPA_asm: hypothetical protein HUJ06_026480 [Nelumbo nucifera]
MVTLKLVLAHYHNTKTGLCDDNTAKQNSALGHSIAS